MKNQNRLFLSLLLVFSIGLVACSSLTDETDSENTTADTTASGSATATATTEDATNDATSGTAADITDTTTTGADTPSTPEPDTQNATVMPEPTATTGNTPTTSGQSTIRMARANWDTGWFQAEIYRQLLEELEYTVEIIESLPPDQFYRRLSEGEFDLWVNGWFPLHNRFLREDFTVRRGVQQIGGQVPGGALQGYFIDKTTADRFDITNLEALEEPDVAAIFDRNGNGQADLIGCNEGWGCEEVINHHLDEYNLRDTVEHIQGEYSDLMRDTVAAYEAGEPILFYTWTPNWPLDKLIADEDVVWLEVPFSTLPGDTFTSTDTTSVEDLEGCAANPCNIGYPPNDIRVVANTVFLHEHPQAEQLFKLVTIPLADINEQNRKWFEGENSLTDIREHAEDWIAENRDEVDSWLEEARNTSEPLPGDSLMWHVLERGSLRCGINSEDFLGFNEQLSDGSYTGFDIDFCRVIAVALFEDPDAVEFVELDDEERFRALENGDVDLVIRDASWTALRDLGMDSPNAGTRLAFGPVILHDGQGFMVRTDSGIGGVQDLDGASICVLQESPDEQNLNEQMEVRDIEFSAVPLSTARDVYTVYKSNGCDAVTASASQLAAQRSEFDDPDEHTVLGSRISREQFAPAFVEGDPLWRDLVSWSIYATIYAEELEQARREELGTDAFELDGETAERLRNSPDGPDNTPEMRRLLGLEGDIGARLGVSNTFAFDIIREVGHYGNIYERNLGQLEIEQRGPNAPWNVGSGGLLYTPPFR
jgi:glycine betaine/proline transport system substrate-binding protein